MPRRADQQIAVFEIRGTGLRETERMTQFQRREVAMEIQEMIEYVGARSVERLKRYAPERSGHLKEQMGITGRNRSVRNPSIRVGGDVRSPTGFPYLRVTRKGRGPVVASKKTAAARTYPQGMAGPGVRGYQKRPWRRHMLAFDPYGPPLGGQTIYRFRVKAYRPARDWVFAAEKEIRKISESSFDDITDVITEILQTRNAGLMPSRPRRPVVKRF